MAFLPDAVTGCCEFREIVNLIADAVDMAGVEHYTFRLAQSEHKGARSVLWLPLSGARVEKSTSMPAQRVGDYQVEFLHEEQISVEARIRGIGAEQGDGFEDAECIRRNVVAAFDSVMRSIGRNHDVGPYEWITQRQGESAHLHATAEVVSQRFTFVAPIPKQAKRVADMSSDFGTAFNATKTLQS